MVRSSEAGRRPAGTSRATTCRSSSRLSMPRVAWSPAGNRRPEVTQPGRGEQPVTDRMERRVAIGVTVQPGGLRDVETRQAQAVEAAERMAVGPPRVSDGRSGVGPWASARHARPGRMAPSILSAAGSPGTVTTGTPWRASISCSSPNRSGPSAKASMAAVSSSRRAPWGVWARNSSDRSAVPVMSPSRHLLEESMTGSTGMAAPWSAAASATRSMRPDVASGRAASWTRTTSPSAGVPRGPPSPGGGHRRSTTVTSSSVIQGIASRAARRSARGDHDDPTDGGSTTHRIDGPLEGRTARRWSPVTCPRHPCGCWHPRQR